MLELYERKLSRTVLRRERGSNPSDLADNTMKKRKLNHCKNRYDEQAKID
jgi:hypothetical protein